MDRLKKLWNCYKEKSLDRLGNSISSNSSAASANKNIYDVKCPTYNESIQMTGIEHRAPSNPLTHLHHHQTIKQTPEAMNSNLTSNHTSSSPLTTDKLTTRDDETHDLRRDTAPGPDHEATPDHPRDPCQGRRLSRESMIKIKSFQSRLPIGDNSEAFLAQTPNDHSPITNSSLDSLTQLSPPESMNPTFWRHESQASHSETTTMTSNRKIYNRWLNKEVPYTTMEVRDSIKRPLMISSPNLDTSKTLTTTDPAHSSSTAITNRLNRTWDPPIRPVPMNLSQSDMDMQISTSSHNLTSQNLDVSLLRKKFINSNNRDRLINTSLDDSLQTKSTSNLTSHQRHQSAQLHPNATHRLDSSPPKRPLKAYNSDSNLATSCMEERKQSLQKRHPEARALSKDSSRKKSPQAPPAPPASLRPVKQPRQKELRSQWCLHRQPPEESPQPKAVLNKTLAETLWGKQLDPEENPTLCRNSLPRQSPASGARSNPRMSIDDQLSEVEIEIQDILAQPLLSESNFSSPSLFDETPTISSQSSSPQTTVQTLH